MSGTAHACLVIACLHLTQTSTLLVLLVVCSAYAYRVKRGYGDYETVDIGRPQVQSSHSIRFPARTVPVPVPVPFPVRHDVPVPVPVSYASSAVPVSYASSAVPASYPLQSASAPVGYILYDAARSLRYPGSSGSTGATIGHDQGSIGVVVGASYGVSGPAKHPGSVLSEPVGGRYHAVNSIQGYGKGIQ